MRAFKIVQGLALLAALLPAAVGAAAADVPVRLAWVFGDHAILQRGRPVAVWGTARPGARVTVAFGGHVAAARAGADGTWRAKLPPLEACADGRVLEATDGTDRARAEDVVVGDVWLCAGQSNMEFNFAWPDAFDAERERAAAVDPLIRLLNMPHRAAARPGREAAAAWARCDTNSIRCFPLVGYYFGRTLRRELGVPVGLIGAAWAGTPGEAWMAAEDAQEVPGLRDEARWRLERVRAGEARGVPEPSTSRDIGACYNGLIAPLFPLTIRGCAWYQGEENATRAGQYADLLPRLVRGWRANFSSGDFPFLIVQLAGYRETHDRPVESGWAEMCWTQMRLGESIPNSGVAVAIDTGLHDDVHPKDKRAVGARLARLALARVYGRPVVDGGPRPLRAVRAEGGARVSFADADGLHARGGGAPARFELAGADGRFVFADARLADGGVLVSSPAVPVPVRVRYAWDDFPVANLVNAADLPSGPFELFVENTTRK